MKKKERVSNIGTHHKLLDTLAKTKIRAGYAVIIFSIFLLLVVIVNKIFYGGNWGFFFAVLFICTALFLAGKSLLDSGNRLSDHVTTGIGNDIRTKVEAVKHSKSLKHARVSNEKENISREHKSKSFIGHYLKRSSAKKHMDESGRQKHCINCGVKIPAKSKFCPECGETQN